MKRMKKLLRSAAVICSTGGFLVIGWKTVPLMQSVQIGGAHAQEQQNEADDTPASTTVTEETQTVTVPELFAPGQQDADPGNIIARESDGSKAMWYSRLYQNPDTAVGGSILEKQYGIQSGTPFFSLDRAGQVRNSTFWTNADLKAESRILPQLDLKLDGTPMVLIYHTHTTESYEDKKTGTYDAGFNFRTTEPDKNMVTVGDAIAQELSAAGIGVVHAGEIHDYPVWNGSYSRSAKTIKEILAAYPSICIALDIHRDAISSGSTVIAPTATINGKKSAQIMIISGCDDGTMNLPNYRENFHLACQLQQTAESMFAGLTRPILFDYRKYNQDLTNGSLLIEVGSQGNTIEEARYAGEMVGQALAETIRSLAAGSE